MKKLGNKVTKIIEGKVKFQGDQEKLMDYAGLIRLAMDIVPPGGYSPKDVQDRVRLQMQLSDIKEDTIAFEDADWDNLKRIVSTSRWAYWDDELNDFLNLFK